MNSIPGDIWDAKYGNYLRTRNVAFLEGNGVVRETLRIGIPQCGREQSLAPKQLQEASILQLQDFLAVAITLQYVCISA